jgi:toxin ParE1/3/4
LERLAKNTGRSRSFLAAEAIAEYLAINEWQVAGIKRAMASLDRGERIAQARWNNGLPHGAATVKGRPPTLRAVTPFWSPDAIEDLAALCASIEQDDVRAAQRAALHIVRNVETLLSRHPAMGRPGRVPGTRELVIPNTPFIVPYRLQSGTYSITRGAGPRVCESWQ